MKWANKLYDNRFSAFQMVCAFGVGVSLTRIIMHFLYGSS